MAHGVAGDHMFVSTLLTDDPNVADEASVATISFLPQPASSGSSPVLYQAGFELDKHITDDFGFAIDEGYNTLTQPNGAKTVGGWAILALALAPCGRSLTLLTVAAYPTSFQVSRRRWRIVRGCREPRS